MTTSREQAGRLAGIASLLVGGYYLAWRFTDTLHPDHPLLSLLLWSGELWALLLSGAFVMATWNANWRLAAPPPDASLSVDVFVPTYDEPIWVVRRTLMAATTMRGNPTVWLLDDGDRPGMRALAAELDCRYLARSGTDGAKAGNLNHALKHATGDLVAIFDADHAPDRSFLRQTVGLFHDPDLAFVQTPQEFYNVDSFQHFPSRTGLWHEQSLFFRVLQPGKDRWNAAFFCGSCAIVRRRALDHVGGFPTETVTEDLHLSLELHARGWRSAFVDRPLAFGLAPRDAEAYQSQRLRWGRGAMQVLSRHNPMTARGLTLAQRIQYSHSVLFWFDGWRSLIFYAMPVLFLTTGVLPIATTAGEFLPRFGLHAAATVASHQLLGRGHGGVARNELFAMVRWWTLLRTTSGLLARKLPFSVTPKGAGGSGVPTGSAVSVAIVAAASLAALVIGGWRVAAGAETWMAAVVFNVGWAVVHVAVAAWALVWLLAGADRRDRTRVAARLPTGWSTSDAAGLGQLVDVTERDARLRLRDRPAVQLGETVWVRVWPLQHEPLPAVVCRAQAWPGGLDIGLHWDLEARHARWRELVELVLVAHSHRGLLTNHRSGLGTDHEGHEPIIVRGGRATTLGTVRRVDGQIATVLADTSVAEDDWIDLAALQEATAVTYQVEAVEVAHLAGRQLQRLRARRCDRSAAPAEPLQPLADLTGPAAAANGHRPAVDVHVPPAPPLNVHETPTTPEVELS